MILDLAYISKDFYTSNQVRSRLIYLLLGLDIIDLYTKSLYYLVNTLISIVDKADICIGEKF